jgi:hypothetical protein
MMKAITHSYKLTPRAIPATVNNMPNPLYALEFK